MPLTTGTRLGPYEITSPLGAGGMGEVFRARDTRLGRDVAVKVLPQHLSDNPEVRSRFEREAKTISSLNHPHICTLFDVGRDGDTDFLVMELVEGETLAQRLAKGALPGTEVLRLGAQIADALDRAHRTGVIHRDLKPGNVMLTKSGAKLMDFGLARATGMSGPASGSGATVLALTQSPTVAAPLTAEGTIVGTFQYMSPEQLEGKEADARADIWALGCVLYEMATGRRAFEGQSQASLISSIMAGQPAPILQVAPLAPAGLDRLVQACLAKDPAERLQSAHDIRMQLAWIAEGGSQAGVPTPVAVSRPVRPSTMVMLGIAGGVAAIAVAAWLALGPGLRGDAQPFFASVVGNPADGVVPVNTGPLTLSPDGTRLATLVRRNGASFVSVYEFGTGKAAPLESTKGAEFPFWSPDGRWIGFFADGKLRKVAATGGPAQALAEAFAGRGGTWSRAGVIVFAPDIRGPLLKVSENGGTPSPVTKPGDEDITHRNPYFLPDGKRFLFIERRSRAEAVGRLMAGSVDGGTPRELMERASNVQFAEGRLLFVRDRSLLAQRFDPGSLKLDGPIVPLAENLAYNNARDVADFSASATGLLAYRHEAAVEVAPAWFDRDGRLVEVLGPKERLVGAKPSRDLRRIALVRSESAERTLDIWLLDPATRQRTRVTFSNTVSSMACAFSPDGQRLAVSSGNVGGGTAASGGWASSALWLQPVSGAGGTETLRDKVDFTVEDWSPDGQALIGTSQRTSTTFDITYVRLDDPKHEIRDFIHTRFAERGARFSPDGRWVLYTSDESGRNEVYVTDFPGANGKWQVSREGGGGGIWSVDGREVFFRQPSGDVMAVSVTHAAGGIQLGAPARIGLSDAPVGGLGGSDGKRFLVGQVDPASGIVPVEVIRNWPALIERGAR